MRSSTILATDIVGFEKVVQFVDDDFTAYIALHSTVLGPALGGCRIKSYPEPTGVNTSDNPALADVLRLAQGMTLKNALAGLNYGGGKMVVNTAKKTPEVMKKIGMAVETLGGQYITAEDVGTNMEDMAIISTETAHVVTGLTGDCSIWTAQGIYAAIMKVMSLKKMTNPYIHVQGLGKVGWNLMVRLREKGLTVMVSDLDINKVDQAVRNFDALKYDDKVPEMVDIYSPCAIGQVIQKVNFGDIHYPVICGSANNQLEDDVLAWKLDKKGILYCPDFLVNAGGVIGAAGEITGASTDDTAKAVDRIGDTLEYVVTLADHVFETPLRIAIGLAQARL